MDGKIRVQVSELGRIIAKRWLSAAGKILADDPMQLEEYTSTLYPELSPEEVERAVAAASYHIRCIKAARAP